ncbi:28297_t:CDS:2, partial [Racocetra persica]
QPSPSQPTSRHASRSLLPQLQPQPQQTCGRSASPDRRSSNQNQLHNHDNNRDAHSSRHRCEAEDRERLFAQNHQIYLLIRQLSDDFQDFRNEMWQRNIQGTQGIQGKDFLAKVWNEVYISIVKCLFLRIIYPTQDKIKESLKDYLNEKFPEFMANLSANDFANWFHGVWCSQ